MAKTCEHLGRQSFEVLGILIIALSLLHRNVRHMHLCCVLIFPQRTYKLFFGSQGCHENIVHVYSGT